MGDEQLLRLGLSALVGMCIGIEREWREKAAGFRTLTLVSVGAALFILLAEDLGGDGVARLGAGVVTGIGFLGAGAILRERGQVVGLTTAAAVWVSAALGMAAGVGAYALTLIGLALSLVVLLLFPAVDLSPYVHDSRTYELTFVPLEFDDPALYRHLRDAGLSVSLISLARSDASTVVAWRAIGRPGRHAEAIRSLQADSSVKEIVVR